MFKAHQTRIGEGTFIHPTAKIRGLNGEATSIVLGDNTYIGEGVEIICDNFELGDYGKIHKYTTIHGYKECRIGNNFWIGQFSIIDCIGGVKIGDNVGVGAHSQLWSHIKYGDRLQGCQYNSEKPLILEDDVWLVGHVICSPGTMKRRSMALAGSVIVGDMEENTIYGGSPAKPMIDKDHRNGQLYKQQFIDNLPIWVKVEKMIGYLKESGVRNVLVVETKDQVDFTNDLTYFVIEDRKYKKTGSVDEVEFMKFLLPEKAKFTPYERGY